MSSWLKRGHLLFFLLFFKRRKWLLSQVETLQGKMTNATIKVTHDQNK